MTQNVNPNSRASFTDRDGRLTKYGMEILADIYRALELVGGVSAINDIKNQLGELAFLPGILAKNTALHDKIGGIEASLPEISVFMSHVADLAQKIDDLHHQLPETAILMAKIQQLEAKIEDLERDSPPTFPYQLILQRLEDIEAQL